jgi:hypothetical protein
MTFVRKFSGDRTAPIVAVYTCPEHGEFDATVERDENGEAPDEIECPIEVSEEQARSHASAMMRGAWCHAHSATAQLPSFAELLASARTCLLPATWTPSPVAGRVRRVEVTRGKYEKPERKTYLDTRKLGEGQPLEEFQAERRKIWRDERMDKARKEFLAK